MDWDELNHGHNGIMGDLRKAGVCVYMANLGYATMHRLQYAICWFGQKGSGC